MAFWMENLDGKIGMEFVVSPADLERNTGPQLPQLHDQRSVV